MQARLYHNPRCSKSRQALDLLRARGVEPELVLYLQEVPTKEQLSALLDKLGGRAQVMIRDGEPEYAELGLDDPSTSRERLLDAIARHPRLLQRPILELGERACVGRPPEAVLEIL